jgi:hypothetical protein
LGSGFFIPLRPPVPVTPGNNKILSLLSLLSLVVSFGAAGVPSTYGYLTASGVGAFSH